MALSALAYVYKNVMLPGERVVDIKKQVDGLSQADKETLTSWASEEQATIA